MAVRAQPGSLPWSPVATRLVLVNVAGGAAVLASYAWGISYLGRDASRAVVGLASAPLAWKAAVAGSIAFCLQTALLEAIVWPGYFSAGR